MHGKKDNLLAEAVCRYPVMLILEYICSRMERVSGALRECQPWIHPVHQVGGAAAVGVSALDCVATEWSWVRIPPCGMNLLM